MVHGSRREQWDTQGQGHTEGALRPPSRPKLEPFLKISPDIRRL